MMFLNLIYTIGVVYFLVLTGRKHNFPLRYENWYDNLAEGSFVKWLLPEDYCHLCYVTQCSVIVSLIIALLLPASLLGIIILIPCSAAYVIYLDNFISK